MLETDQYEHLPNLYPYEGADHLPEGSFLPDKYIKAAAEEYVFPLEIALREIIQEMKGIEKFTKLPFSGWELEEKLFYELYDNNEQAHRVLEKLLEKFPNLAWVRGGELATNGRHAILDRTGWADGLLGVSVEKWIKTGYDARPRKNPVLMYIPFKDLLQAAKDGLFIVNTHHGYDVSVHYNSSTKESKIKIEKWLEDHLKVFQPK